MAERIFVMDSDGNLEPMNEQRFESEDALQELIASNPELIDGEQIRPGDARRWILITREMGIANRWAVDHLIIDQDAIPTLLEVKRGENSQVRREVVGQMMDYAAHWTTTWSIDEIRQTFENNEDDPEMALSALLQDDEPDADAFWENVAINLTAKRLRLLFLADKIPDELTRVVEFLNEEMPRIEVLAVEIKQFMAESSNARTLVPRIIGRLSAKPASRSGRAPQVQQTKEEFLDRFDNDSAREAAARLIGVAENTPRAYYRGARRMSIQVNCPLWRNPISLAWLTPPGNADDFEGDSNHFVFGRFQNDRDFPEALDERLQQWIDDLMGEGKAINPWDSQSEDRYSVAVTYTDVVERIDTLVERLQSVINDLANLQSS